MPRSGSARPESVFTESCWWCRGTGTVPAGREGLAHCPRCDGTGRLPMLRQPTLPGESV